MNVLDTRDELLKVFACCTFRQLLVLHDQVEQFTALNELHDQVQIFLGLNDFINLYHVRMVQLL